jgi:hypothetical protein
MRRNPSHPGKKTPPPPCPGFVNVSSVGETSTPSQRIQDLSLKNAVSARAAILRALDAVKAGRTPEDTEATRSVAGEIQDAADELLDALKNPVTLVG